VPAPRPRHDDRACIDDAARSEGARQVGRYERELRALVEQLTPDARNAVASFLEAAATAASEQADAFWRPVATAPERTAS
jgi:hypothetical protein